MIHIGGIEFEVRDIRSLIERKADQHEIHTLRSNVDSLEHTVRELSARIDGLCSRLSEIESLTQREMI